MPRRTDFHSDAASTSVFVSRVLLGILPQPTTGRRPAVIEVGCGAGAVLEELRGHGFDVVGVDTSEEQVALARAAGLVVEQGDTIAFLRGLTHEPDAILAIDFLEHLTNVDGIYS